MAKINNRAVLNKLKTHSLMNTTRWLAECYQLPEEDLGKIRPRVSQLKVRFKHMQKYKTEDGEKALEGLLEEPFNMPKKAAVAFVPQQSTDRPHTSTHRQCTTTASELAQLETPATKHISVKALGEEIKERDLKIKELKEQLKGKDDTIAGKDDTIAGKDNTIAVKTKALNKLEKKRNSISHKERYYRLKCAKLEGKQIDEPQQVEDDEPESVDETEDLRKEIIELHYKNDILQEQLETSNVVELFDEYTHQYTTQTQRCVQSLLTDNVATNRVGNVITIVLKLADKEPNKVPSTHTVKNMNLQRLVLAQQQIAEELPSHKYTTMETDESSKFGQKYGAYAIRDTEGRPYVVGLRDLTTKSAKDTLDVFKQILWDIDKLYYEPTNSSTSQNLLFNLRNTMSDRAATEGKFNELLEAYRSEVLPLMVEGWRDLSDELQNQLSRMNNFFCGLHGLVHIAEASNSSTKEVEALHFGGSDKVPIRDARFRKQSESGVCRMVRTVCKVFAYGGDAKTSCHGRFILDINDLLKDNGYRSLPLTPYRGNRFNILFHNACCIYWLHTYMIDFLEKDGAASWVLYDLKEPFFMAGCKALGLICKLITTPLWNLIEDPTINIIDMNERYLQLVTFLKDISQNTDIIDDFLTGKLLPFPDVNVKNDVLYRSLIAPSEVHDADCIIILASIFPALAKVTQRLYHDHLPGGRYEAASQDVRNATKGTAKHNKYCETIFAFYDQMLRTRPHISTIAAEASLMFTFNKTTDWLAAKTEEEEKKLMEDSRKEVTRIEKEFKERQKKMKVKKLELLRERFQKEEEAKKRKLNARIKQANDICYWGLLQSEDQVDEARKGLTNSEQLELLKAQLKFRKNLLEQKSSDAKIFNISVQVGDSKRRQLSCNEMAENVKQLIREGQQRDGEEELSSGTASLVNKRVKHKFETTDEGTKWWSGRVISQVHGYPSWYNIVYSESPETVYTYKLREDLVAGDLVVIEGQDH